MAAEVQMGHFFSLCCYLDVQDSDLLSTQNHSWSSFKEKKLASICLKLGTPHSYTLLTAIPSYSRLPYIKYKLSFSNLTRLI